MAEDPPKYALLACDVFADELAALGGDSPPWAELRFLEMGLHDNPARLRVEIQQVIDDLSVGAGLSHIVLAYALCGNGLIGVRAGGIPLILPRAHDCISLLLGSVARQRALLREQPGSYFYSPGWIRGRRVPGPDRNEWLKKFYTERYPDDAELVDDLLEADRETFAHYKRALYVDITGDCGAESYCKNCARAMSWEYGRLAGDPRWLRDLLFGHWDADRFLEVPPGARIALAGEDLVAEMAT